MNYNYCTFLITLLLFCSEGFAQRYAFSYDNAGNRIERQFLVLRTDQSLGNSEIHSSINEHNIKLFPNPTSDRVNIETNLEPDDMGLFDLNGREMPITITKKESISIDVSSFPAGTYLLKIRFGKQEKTWKVILI